MNKKGTWPLAPAFDMTFSYRKDSLWVSEHQMLINGKSREITKDDFLKVAELAGIKKTTHWYVKSRYTMLYRNGFLSPMRQNCQGEKPILSEKDEKVIRHFRCRPTQVVLAEKQEYVRRSKNRFEGTNISKSNLI